MYPTPAHLLCLVALLGQAWPAQAQTALSFENAISLTLNSPVNVVVGREGEEVYIASAGIVFTGRGASAGLEVFDARGTLRWRDVYRADECDYLAGAYVQWMDGDPPMLAYSVVPQDEQRLGAVRLLNARDGALISHTPNTSRFGNNNSLVADLDADGRPEFLYADLSSITSYEIPSMQRNWRLDTGVRFCWSLPALSTAPDVPPLIVFGSEYNNADHSSSMLAVDLNGAIRWRSDGHSEDLGSTPVFPARLQADTERVFLKVGLDLEHRLQQEWNHLHIFSLRGELQKRLPLGFTGIALGDLNGDGTLDGVGISNTRDGGNNGRREIRALDLARGGDLWTLPVSRAYLDTNSPIMADFEGDGRPQVLVGTGNPAGYARLPQSEPWGDLYRIRADGTLLQRIQLPGWPVNLALCDLNGNGRNELLVVVDGKPGHLYVYSTGAAASRNDWPTPFGNAARTGNMLRE